MAGGLFDISEPGESPVKAACAGRAIGIDLGTTNSLVAVVTDARPRCLSDAEGRTLLPSVVRYVAGGAPVVGAQAFAEAAQFPLDTIVSVKRFMGRAPSDIDVGRFAPFKLASMAGSVVRFAVAGDKQVTPVEVSAEILRVLKVRAETALGGPLDGAVITVPAYFDDGQRQATKDAAKLAGLEVLRLINEPTAAALAYGLDKKSEGLFAVYDLGGGTFDVSILKLTNGVFEVKSTAGDTSLGGDDFDRALCEHVLKERNVDADADTYLSDPGEQRALLDACRANKHLLTTETEVMFHLGGNSIPVTRDEFDELVTPIVARTGAACRRALKDAGVEPKALDGVILVGGATRTPIVRRFVEQLFGRAPLTDLNPDEVVALGASVQADLLAGAGRRDDVLLLDVIPLSLGLELMGGVVEKVIHRNSTMPAGAKQTFTTYADNQTGFDLHVVQGERETAAECRSLARFALRGIPPAPAGMARLEVTFMVDADGLLSVAAREETTGKEASIAVKPSYGLTDEEVEKMLLDSYEYAEKDVNARLLIDARVEAERIITALDNALVADAALLDADERARIDGASGELRAAIAGTNHRQIRSATELLDHASKPFAEKRMNQSIVKAMAGHKVADVEKSVEHAKGLEGHQ